MLRKFLLVLMIGIIFNICDVSAMDIGKNCYLINNNQLCIAEDEYINLVNLGYSETEIANLSMEEYEENRNLKADLVSKKVSYYYGNMEVDEEEYNEIQEKSNITPFALIETPGKKMTTTSSSFNGKYRYKVSVEWKTMPKVRSHDIIAIGLEPTKVQYSTNRTFNMNYCASKTNCTNSNSATFKNTITGLGAVFQLPTDSIMSLNMYLYYDVNKKADKVTSMNAYGDYSHAVKSTTSILANCYNLSNRIILPESIISNYDEINTSVATWTGNW